jgi:hypothetical protein
MMTFAAFAQRDASGGFTSMSCHTNEASVSMPLVNIILPLMFVSLISLDETAQELYLLAFRYLLYWL